jgi:hypothetical protein
MVLSNKEMKALEKKVGNRHVYFGNSGNVKVSGSKTMTNVEFNKREKKGLRQMVPGTSGAHAAFQAYMRRELGW